MMGPDPQPIHSFCGIRARRTRGYLPLLAPTLRAQSSCDAQVALTFSTLGAGAGMQVLAVPD